MGGDIRGFRELDSGAAFAYIEEQPMYVICCHTTAVWSAGHRRLSIANSQGKPATTCTLPAVTPTRNGVPAIWRSDWSTP